MTHLHEHILDMLRGRERGLRLHLIASMLRESGFRCNDVRASNALGRALVDNPQCGRWVACA